VTHVRGGDPSLAFDSQGRLFWSYLSVPLGDNLEWSGIEIMVAQCDPTTGAILGGYPVNVSQAIGLNPEEGDDDKQWLAADFHASSPFADRLYLAWTRFLPASPWTQVLTTHSTDQGMTWSSPALELGGGAAQGFVWPVHNAVDPDGVVYVAFHSQTGWNQGVPNGYTGKVFVRRSFDGGVTYPPPVTLAFLNGEADITFNVQSRPGTILGTQFWMQGSAQPWVLPDPNTPGRIYVVACDDPDNQHGVGDDADVFMVTSTDPTLFTHESRK
jgi:hypothetical protein